MKITLPTYRKIIFITLVVLFAITVTGGAVRLTGSGLGCSDWPTCEEEQFVADLEYHSLIEFTNRVFTGAIALIVIVAALGAIFLEPRRKNLIWWSMGLVFGLLSNAILGGIVVLTHLETWTVIGHFLLSIALLYNAVVLHHKTRPDVLGTGTAVASNGKSGGGKSIRSDGYLHIYIVWLTRLVTALAVAIICAGTILTGAGPHRGDEDVEGFDLDISNLARIHGSLVASLLFVMALGWLALYIYHRDSHHAVWKKGKWLLGITLAQGFIGYVQYFSDIPALLVGIHIAGATAFWIAIIYFHLEVCPPLKGRQRLGNAQPYPGLEQASRSSPPRKSDPDPSIENPENNKETSEELYHAKTS